MQKASACFRHASVAKFVAILCLLAVTVVHTVVAVSARETGLPANLLIGDQDGIHVDSTGEYCIYVTGIEPGDIITKKITIQNLATNDNSPEAKIPYKLTMRSEEDSHHGPINLFEKITMEIKLDGAIIYSGGLDGTEGSNIAVNPLNLGTYAVGDRRVLDVTFVVADDLWTGSVPNEKSECDFIWYFHASRGDEPPITTNVTEPPTTDVTGDVTTVTSDEPPTTTTTRRPPPITGDMTDFWWMLPIFLMTFTYFFLVPLKRRRDEKYREECQVSKEE